MISIFRFVFPSAAVFLMLGCSPAEEQSTILHSEISEGAWLATCSSRSSTDDPDCFDREIVWVLTLQEETVAGHLIANLGPRTGGLRAEVDLKDTDASLGEEVGTRTFFVAGHASLELTVGQRPMVRIAEAEVLGFQTLVQGPKQGALAAEMTLAEFGRYCLLAPVETYTDQCAGKRVLWYGLLRGAAPDGVIMGLPFEEASFARVKTSEELNWPIGNTSVLRDSPIVIEGVLAPEVSVQENGGRVPTILEAHIIAFSRRVEPIAEITGVE